jgi:hypothetical protein
MTSLTPEQLDHLIASACRTAEELGVSVFPVRVEPDPSDPNKATKRPLIKGWANGSAVSTPEAIETLFREHAHAATHCGIQTGRVVVIDIDGEQAQNWWRAHLDMLPMTRTVDTRRPGGKHLFYRVPANVELRNSAGKIAPGVDFRGAGGFVVDWSAEHPPAVEEVADAPATLIEFLQRASSSREQPDGNDGTPGDGFIREGGRNAFLSKEAFRLRKLGFSIGQIFSTLQAMNIACCRPPLGDAEVRQISEGKESVQPGPLPVGDASTPRPETMTPDEMLERFVHVTRGPMIVDRRNTSRRMRPHEFAAAYAHLKITIDKKALQVTSLWSQSDRRILADDLTFHPGRGPFYVERGMTHMNLWDPPTWPETDITQAAIFLEHLEYLIPDQAQREDLLDWLAHAVQRTEVRPHFHFLLIAPQEGTGRSWLGDLFVRLWGTRHADQVDLHSLMEDAFNSKLTCKVMLVVHEAKAAPDERFNHRERLRNLLSDSIVTINEKHQPKWNERFCARVLMFTNSDNALPLSETDRRVYAVRCADQPRDAAYYSRLYGALGDEGFLAAVWTFLKNRNIAQFNPGRRAPLNQIKRQLIAAGRTEVQQDAVELVRASPHDIIGSTDLMQALVPQENNESTRDHDQRVKAVTAVLKDIGAQTHPRKIKVVGQTTRAWMLRNAVEWSGATPAKLSAAARAAHDDFVRCGFNADALLDEWNHEPS